jgi:type I restriction enzyme S subunit
MSEWKELSISEISSRITSGGTPRTSRTDYYANGNIPWLKTQEINFNRIWGTETHITDKAISESSAKIIEKDSVIIAMYGVTAGKVAINKIELSTNQACCNITPNRNICDYRYLYYYICSQYDELVNLSTGAAQQNLSVGVISEFQITLPPLIEQERIAEVLSSLDDKIDLLQRQNKTLEEIAETLFRQWFVEEAEDECKKITLGELVKVIDNRGKTPAFTETKTDYPIIEVNALNGKNRYIDYSLIKKYVDEHTYNNWFRAGHPKLNDILFSTVGSIGEMSMMLNPAGTIAQNIVAIRAEKISPYYLYQYLMSIQDEIKEFDIGSVQPSIKVTHLIKIEIPIPDSKKVNMFDNQAKDICNKISVNYNQIQKLESLRDTLLPKLMSGDIRVK